jgi:hypothetical protein
MVILLRAGKQTSIDHQDERQCHVQIPPPAEAWIEETGSGKVS